MGASTHAIPALGCLPLSSASAAVPFANAVKVGFVEVRADPKVGLEVEVEVAAIPFPASDGNLIVLNDPANNFLDGGFGDDVEVDGSETRG